MNILTPQFFIGFIIGVLALGALIIIYKPLAGTWAKDKIKILKNENNYLKDQMQKVQKGDEQIFDYWMNANAEKKILKERIRFLEEQNKDLGDAVLVLSNEKSALQDLKNKYYIQLDKTRVELRRLTSPAYAKSFINKDGKLKDEKN